MTMERSMKKLNLIAATGALSLIIGLLSFTGASAEDSNKNSGGNKSNSNNSSLNRVVANHSQSQEIPH